MLSLTRRSISADQIDQRTYSDDQMCQVHVAISACECKLISLRAEMQQLEDRQKAMLDHVTNVVAKGFQMILTVLSALLGQEMQVAEAAPPHIPTSIFDAL